MRLWPARRARDPRDSSADLGGAGEVTEAFSLDRPWSAAELWIGAAVFLPLWFVLYFVALVPLGPLAGLPGLSWDYASPIAANFVYLVTAGATASLFLWGRKQDLNRIVGLSVSWRHIPPILAALAAAVLVATVSLALIPPSAMEESESPAAEAAALQPEPWLDTFSMVVAAPVVEEILFRAVLFAGFTTVYGPFLGASVSSAIFAAYHLNLEMFLPHFAFGLLAAHLYRRAGSLAVPILFHSAWNALVLIVASVLS